MRFHLSLCVLWLTIQLGIYTSHTVINLLKVLHNSFMNLCLYLSIVYCQVEYIVQLENFKAVRRRARLANLKFVQNVNKRWRDRMRGVDYKSQAELVEELYDETFDSEGDNKVCYVHHVIRM